MPMVFSFLLCTFAIRKRACLRTYVRSLPILIYIFENVNQKACPCLEICSRSAACCLSNSRMPESEVTSHLMSFFSEWNEMSKGRTKLSFLYYSLLFTYCQFISRSVFSFLMFVSKNVVRFAPIEAERRKDCGNATHGTIRRHHSWGLSGTDSFSVSNFFCDFAAFFVDAVCRNHFTHRGKRIDIAVRSDYGSRI